MTQSFSQNLQHIFFSTKERNKWIDESWAEDLYGYIGGILGRIECQMLSAGGTSDHIHLLSIIDKKLTIPEVIRTIKSSSTTWIRKSIKSKKAFAWQIGYASFSIGKSQIPRVDKYIRNQRNHHRKIDYKDELRKFLKKYGLEYDEKYLWK